MSVTTVTSVLTHADGVKTTRRVTRSQDAVNRDVSSVTSRHSARPVSSLKTASVCFHGELVLLAFVFLPALLSAIPLGFPNVKRVDLSHYDLS